MAVDIGSIIIYAALLAYVPPIIYVVLVRYSEKYKREPWGALFSAFLFGATLGFIVLTLLRGYIDIFLERNQPEVWNDLEKRKLVQGMLLVPFMMLVLPAGLLTVRHELDESEDGIIYGAAVGLGYAAPENMVYGFYTLLYFGMDYFINLVIIRDLTVMLLFSSAASFVGYGVTRATSRYHRKGSLLASPLFYLAGVGMVAGFVFMLNGGPRIYLGMDNMDLTTSLRMAGLFSIFVGMASWALMYFTIWRTDRLDELWDDEEDERTRKAAQRRQAIRQQQAQQQQPHYARQQAQQQQHAHYARQQAQQRQAHHHQHQQPRAHHHAQPQSAHHQAHHHRPPAQQPQTRRAPAPAPAPAPARPKPPAKAGAAKPKAKAKAKVKAKKKMKPAPEPKDEEEADEDWLDEDYGEDEAKEFEKSKKAKVQKSARKKETEELFDLDSGDGEGGVDWDALDDDDDW